MKYFLLSESCSVTSNCLRPQGVYSPWNSPGQNTAVGKSESEVTQSCPILCNLREYAVHGILQARILQWVKVKVKSPSCVWLIVTPWTVACQAPLSLGFSRQEYWSGLPCASPGDLPNPRIEPRSPELQVDSLLSEPPGKHSHTYIYAYTCVYVCVQSRAEKHL